MKIIIELTEIQYDNLIEFLKRVNMSGEEAFAYVELMGILHNAKNAIGTTGGFSRRVDEIMEQDSK